MNRNVWAGYAGDVRREEARRGAIRTLAFIGMAALTAAVGGALATTGMPPGPPPAWPSGADVVHALTAAEPPLEAVRYVASMAGWSLVAYLGAVLVGRIAIDAASLGRDRRELDAAERAWRAITLPPLRTLLEGSLAGAVFLSALFQAIPKGATAQAGGQEGHQTFIAWPTAIAASGTALLHASSVTSGEEQPLGLHLPLMTASDGLTWASTVDGGSMEMEDAVVIQQPSAWSNAVMASLAAVGFDAEDAASLDSFLHALNDRYYSSQIWAFMGANRLAAPPIPGPPAAIEFREWAHVYAALDWLLGTRPAASLTPLSDPVYLYIPVPVVAGAPYEWPGLHPLLKLLDDWGAYDSAHQRIEIHMPGDIYQRIASAPDPVEELLRAAPGRDILFDAQTRAVAQRAREWLSSGRITLPVPQGATVAGGPALRTDSGGTQLVWVVQLPSGGADFVITRVADSFWTDLEESGAGTAASRSGGQAWQEAGEEPAASAAGPGGVSARAMPTAAAAPGGGTVVATEDIGDAEPHTGDVGEGVDASGEKGAGKGNGISATSGTSSVPTLAEIMQGAQETAAAVGGAGDRFAASPLGRWLQQHLGDRYVRDPRLMMWDGEEATFWAYNPAGLPLISRSWNDAPPPPPAGIDPVIWLNIVYALEHASSWQAAREAADRVREAAQGGSLLGGPLPGQPVDALGLPILSPNTPETVRLEIYIPEGRAYRGHEPWPALQPLMDLFREWGARIVSYGSSRYIAVDVPREAYEAYQLSGDISQLVRQAPGYSRLAGGGS